MLPRDFTETLNAAIQSKDWPLVIVLAESAVAEKEASPQVLYNLGLAYLKSGNFAMANSVLVSIPEGNRDADVNLALDEALRLSGSSRDDLEIGNPGIEGVGIRLAQQLSPVDLTTWCVFALGATFVLAAILFAFRKSAKLLRVLIGLTLANVGVVIALLLGLWVTQNFQSHWGAVVDDQGAIIRVSRSPESEAKKTLTKGKPILVVGEPRSEWVRVMDSSGGIGWVQGLHIRVIH